MTDFFIRVKRQFEQNLPFVIYSKPGDNRLIGLFQQDDHLYFSEHLTESGFVMAPFHGGSKVLIPDTNSEEMIVAVPLNTDDAPRPQPAASDSDRTSYVDLVAKALTAIGNGEFSKVVLSRAEALTLIDFNAATTFEKLACTYPNALTYCWFHPKVGMWLGATPEQLVRTEDGRYHTVALAGTRAFNGTSHIKWDKKEQDEQQYVTEYIMESLRGISSEINVSSPYTSRAGNLLHIKTDIEVVVKSDVDLCKFVKALHPTPAVCGVPKTEAMDFIIANENYDREFYSGYLGEINKDGHKSDLYVNLRCMKVADGKAFLFVGCGVTKDSNPQDEYLETVNKSMTLKRIIK